MKDFKGLPVLCFDMKLLLNAKQQFHLENYTAHIF
jgi:hypothetical protein